MLTNIKRTIGFVALIVLVAVTVGVGTAQGDGPGNDELAAVEVWGKVQMENSCYARLPDLPAARYGGHGGYNADTGVLAYVGGAQKATTENTIAFYQLYGIKLDGSENSWSTINYQEQLGYTRDNDHGCREMATVKLADDRWVSVGGKDGCDGDGNTGSKGGDIKMIKVGDESNSQQVNFVKSSVITTSLTADLLANKFKLARAFAVLDTKRDRVVFGQGTFDDEKDQDTQDEVYQAVLRGSQWQVQQLRPPQPWPSRRFGTCAAYVPDADGVFVLGGQQGGPSGSGATTYKEVWWLGFDSGAQGKWTDITGRFTNMDAIGYRREGACAYDPDNKTYYTWMGRADGGIPEGDKRSAGFWKVDLSQIGDENAQLTWVRLAKDKQTEVKGRRLVPNVWDSKNKRFFAIGGRNDLAEWADVWALYPEAQCDQVEVIPPTPTPTTVPPTNTPKPTDPGGQTPVPPTPTVMAGDVCDIARRKVPNQVINDAVANPGSYYGYDLLCNPNLLPGPFNQPRRMLSLTQPSKPFHPLYNSVEWKCGCP